MTKFRSTLVPIATLVLAGALVLACGDDEPDAGSVGTAVGQVTGAQDDFCEKLDDLGESVQKAGNLSSTSTVDDAREVRDEVEENLEAVRDAAGNVTATRLGAIQTAYQALNGAIDSVPSDSTLGAAAGAIATQSQAIGQALEGVMAETDCSASNP